MEMAGRDGTIHLLLLRSGGIWPQLAAVLQLQKRIKLQNEVQTRLNFAPVNSPNY
jgi:hypothetical protein